MNTSSVFKKRILLFSLSVIFIGVCIIITFIFNKENKNDLVVNKKNIQVTYENAKNGINTSEYPLKYEDGTKKSPSNIIKVSNKLDTKLDYVILVTTDHTNVESLDPSKIYVSIDNEEGRLLNSLEEGIVYEGSLNAKEVSLVDLKIWIASELVNTSDNGKSLGINVEVREK